MNKINYPAKFYSKTLLESDVVGNAKFVYVFQIIEP